MSGQEAALIPLFDTRREMRSSWPALQAGFRDVVERGDFVGGETVERFEEAWASYCGAAHCVGVGSGTAALHLALAAAGAGPGTEVVTVGATFAATIEAIVHTGSTPVVVDVDPETLTIDPAAAAAAIGPATAAMVVVHLYGRLADMGELRRVADRHGVALIEDACQAHGATADGRRAGTFGHAGCFSFYPTKNLGAPGDGGAVVTNDPALAAAVRRLSDHGRSAYDRNLHESLGFNSRLGGLAASALLARLDGLDAANARRREAAAVYRHRFAADGVERLVRLVVPEPAGTEAVHHLFCLRVPDRDWWRDELAKDGVASGFHYPIPAHRQPGLARFCRVPEQVDNTEDWAATTLTIPMFPALTDAEVRVVCDAVASAAELFRAEAEAAAAAGTGTTT